MEGRVQHERIRSARGNDHPGGLVAARGALPPLGRVAVGRELDPVLASLDEVGEGVAALAVGVRVLGGPPSAVGGPLARLPPVRGGPRVGQCLAGLGVGHRAHDLRPDLEHSDVGERSARDGDRIRLDPLTVDLVLEVVGARRHARHRPFRPRLRADPVVGVVQPVVDQMNANRLDLTGNQHYSFGSNSLSCLLSSGYAPQPAPVFAEWRIAVLTATPVMSATMLAGSTCTR